MIGLKLETIIQSAMDFKQVCDTNDIYKLWKIQSKDTWKILKLNSLFVKIAISPERVARSYKLQDLCLHQEKEKKKKKIENSSVGNLKPPDPLGATLKRALRILFWHFWSFLVAYEGHVLVEHKIKRC